MSERYFNLTKEQATQTVSDVQTYGVVPSGFFLFCVGFIFEIFGRKYVIFSLLLFAGAFYILMPIVSPNRVMFIAISIGGGTMVAQTNNMPLLQDYVEINSRGKAQGIQAMGVAFGIICSLGVVVQFTKQMI